MEAYNALTVAIEHKTTFVLKTLEAVASKKHLLAEVTRSQRNLLAQAVSALNSYPEERRKNHRNFYAFGVFTQSQGQGFYIGGITGEWNAESSRFVLQKIVIYQVYPTIDLLREQLSVAKHLNPGIPQLMSDSCRARFAKVQQ